MDPIGLAFEQFDAIGQFRTTENGVTIDVSGAVNLVDEPALAGTFTGVRELGDQAGRQRPGARLRGDAVVPLRRGAQRGRRPTAAR